MRNVEINIIGVLISALIVLILAFCILFILYHYKKRQNFFLQEVELLKVTFEKELLQAQLEIQEQTFQHISLELHDNVGHYISLAKLYLLTITAKDDDETGKLNSSVDLLSTSLQEIRTLCSNLNTNNLQNNGLIRTVDHQVRQLSKSGQFTVDFSVTGQTVYMDEKKELILFRILQEALNNIIKHSGADTVSIQLEYLNNSMKLRIADNGKGFDLEAFKQHNSGHSSGIRNILNRSSMINAIPDISSIVGNGTVLQIITPYT